MNGPLTRAETRRIAEIQMSIKQIDFEIQASSCESEVLELRTRRSEVDAELRSIIASASNRPFGVVDTDAGGR